MAKTDLEIKKIIDELDELLTDGMRSIQNKNSHSAPQSYYDEMNGCARGISIAKGKAIEFLRKRLLG